MLCVSNLILIFWGLIYAVRPVMQPRDQLLAQCMFINVVIILTVFKYALSFWCSSAVVIYVLKRSSLDLTDGVRHVKSVLRGSQISLTMRMTVDEVKEKKKRIPSSESNLVPRVMEPASIRFRLSGTVEKVSI